MIRLAELVERSRLLHAAARRRVLIGIVGAPGAGKSTLAEALHAAVAESALLPMDGYHLSQRQLDRLGRADRKGAPDTFDAAGFAAMLARVRAADDDVYVPFFDRTLEEPIAAGLVIEQAAQIVFVEGNYLLLRDAGWAPVAGHLDEVWYLDPPLDQRHAWLINRHESFGRTRADAAAWVQNVDEPNARLIAHGRDRVDLVIPAWSA